MAERKSKRKAPPKVDEEAEPTGVKKVAQHPIVVLFLVIALVIGAILGIFAISRWLSGS